MPILVIHAKWPNVGKNSCPEQSCPEMQIIRCTCNFKCLVKIKPLLTNCKNDISIKDWCYLYVESEVKAAAGYFYFRRRMWETIIAFITARIIASPDINIIIITFSLQCSVEKTLHSFNPLTSKPAETGQT